MTALIFVATAFLGVFTVSFLIESYKTIKRAYKATKQIISVYFVEPTSYFFNLVDERFLKNRKQQESEVIEVDYKVLEENTQIVDKSEYENLKRRLEQLELNEKLRSERLMLQDTYLS